MNPATLLKELKTVGRTDARTAAAIVTVLLRIPIETGEWALQHLFFHCPEDVPGHAYEFVVPDTTVKERGFVLVRLVYISRECANGPEASLLRTITHEIAHLWLRHGMLTYGPHERNRHATEVKRLLVQWGF